MNIREEVEKSIDELNLRPLVKEIQECGELNCNVRFADIHEVGDCENFAKLLSKHFVHTIMGDGHYNIIVGFV